MRNTTTISVAVIVAAVMIPAARLTAQTFHYAGTEFNAARTVEIPDEKHYTVVVTEFFHHGEISLDGKNVIVLAKNKTLVPMRVLQLGPGDFCRLAFQTERGQSEYEILYGGDPPTEALPPWTSRDGLLLETRHFRQCDLQKLDKVREAFEAAPPIGSDYVSEVRHACNPVTIQQGPFLSRYSGTLHIDVEGSYRIFTSSQDCSFLLIDDKLVIAAPGRHGPTGDTRPGTWKQIRLSAGLHKFEYYHAAASANTTMLAAWIAHPVSPKERPTAIGGEASTTYLVGHLPAGRVTTRTAKLVPDFLMKIAGEVPLPDNPLPMLGVAFRDASARSLSMQGKPLWDFGDGQTSTSANPNHVYLRPGLYTVKLTMKHNERPVEMVNRIYVDRPLPLRPRQATHAQSIPRDHRNLPTANTRCAKLAATGVGL